MEFKGTKGKRVIVERDGWFDVVSNNERITSFDKSDNRSVYDALLDSKSPEMLEQLHKLSMMCLQSERYRAYTDFKIEVDNSLSIIKSATEL